MKNQHYLLLLILFIFGCSSSEDESIVEPYVPSGEVKVEETYYDEQRNRTVRLLDITGLYLNEMVGLDVLYMGLSVPVNHVPYDQLPAGLKEPVKRYWISGQTQVYQLTWKGETMYQLKNLFIDQIEGVYRPSGEKVSFQSYDHYLGFYREVSEITCLLLLDKEEVKSADGAPNLLPGTWQTDWKHLHHDSSVDETVELYTDLPFTITEVCHFEDNGTGYLRTVKTFKDGQQEMALDPFTYELTNYRTEASSFQRYEYRCCFAAGDTIEYSAQTRDGFNNVFDRAFIFVTFPWYKKTADPYEGQQALPKYGTPAKDSEQLIVGRWIGVSKGSAVLFGISRGTWVFRADGTGYMLIGNQFNQSFVYTLNDSTLTIYKYDTGFYADDGFHVEGDVYYNYVPEPLPQGKSMKVKIYGNGDLLEIEGYSQRAADFTEIPIVYHRQP